MNIFYTGLISAIVSVLTALAAFQMRVLGDSLLLRKQHEWDQRRELRKLVARYHARLLEAALDWDRRMQQAYAGEYRWLSPSGSDRTCREQYFFHSMIYRFLALLTAARDFEKEAFFIDARISDRQKELVFLRFAKSFIWAMTHGDLTPEDGMPGRDHFPNDMFKALLDRCAKPTTLSAPAHAGANSESPVAPGFFDWDTYWWFIDGLADLPAPRGRLTTIRCRPPSPAASIALRTTTPTSTRYWTSSSACSRPRWVPRVRNRGDDGIVSYACIS